MMNRGNFFRRSLISALSLIFLLNTALVGATVKLYTATGEDYANEFEPQNISKQRALDKAVKKATEQAGVYLKTYSRSINSELSDDEITAITSNAWQLVGEPKYTSEIINHSADTQIVVWKVTVEVNVDDSEIQSWIKRDDKDKSQIINQTREALKSSAENERKIEDLREQYNRATTQAEKDNIRKQMNDADRNFLANQKFEEGLKLYYAKDYDGAIKLYNEAIELKPDYAEAYNNRGIAYDDLKQHDRAIADYSKAIALKPNLAGAYNNRGAAYNDLKQHDRALADYNKAIELKPNYFEAYNNRGAAYNDLKQYDCAIADFDKALAFNPNLAEAYYNRGNAYYYLQQYDRAIADYAKAIELKPDYAKAYYNCGVIYDEIKKYDRAIANYNRTLEFMQHPYIYGGRGEAYYYLKNYTQAFADLNKAIDMGLEGKDLGEALYYRGLCYQALGDTAKAQADFARAKELGYNG